MWSASSVKSLLVVTLPASFSSRMNHFFFFWKGRLCVCRKCFENFPLPAFAFFFYAELTSSFKKWTWLKICKSTSSPISISAVGVWSIFFFFSSTRTQVRLALIQHKRSPAAVSPASLLSSIRAACCFSRLGLFPFFLSALENCSYDKKYW